MVSKKSGHLYEKRLILKIIKVSCWARQTTLKGGVGLQGGVGAAKLPALACSRRFSVQCLCQQGTARGGNCSCQVTGQAALQRHVISRRSSMPSLCCFPAPLTFGCCGLLQETGRDPVTSEALGEDDLLELTSSQGVKPRPTPATSIPGLLSLFQNVRRGCNVAHTYHFERLARSRSSVPEQESPRAQHRPVTSAGGRLARTPPALSRPAAWPWHLIAHPFYLPTSPASCVCGAGVGCVHA